MRLAATAAVLLALCLVSCAGAEARRHHKREHKQPGFSAPMASPDPSDTVLLEQRQQSQAQQLPQQQQQQIPQLQQQQVPQPYAQLQQLLTTNPRDQEVVPLRSAAPPPAESVMTEVDAKASHEQLEAILKAGEKTQTRHRHTHKHKHHRHRHSPEDDDSAKMRFRSHHEKVDYEARKSAWRAVYEHYYGGTAPRSYYEHYYSNPRFQERFYPAGFGKTFEEQEREHAEQRAEAAKAQTKSSSNEEESLLESAEKVHHKRVDYHDSINSFGSNDRFRSTSAYGLGTEDNGSNAYGPPLAAPSLNLPNIPSVNSPLNGLALDQQLTSTQQVSPLAQQAVSLSQQLQQGQNAGQLMQFRSVTSLDQQIQQQQQQLAALQALQQQQQQQQQQLQQAQQAQQQTQVQQSQGQASGNPNPSGIPMPFYAPTPFLPPAPNQVPFQANAVNNLYSKDLVTPTSSQMNSATTSSPSPPNSNANIMNPNAPRFQSSQSNYPFGGFIEIESVERSPASDLVHPRVYHLATHPDRLLKRTPLLAEHMEPFPLLQ